MDFAGMIRSYRVGEAYAEADAAEAEVRKLKGQLQRLRTEHASVQTALAVEQASRRALVDYGNVLFDELMKVDPKNDLLTLTGGTFHGRPERKIDKMFQQFYENNVSELLANPKGHH